MPKNYKTYTSPKSFSEFQLRVPDQTGKIEEQTKRTIRGAEKAQQFQRENQEIYLRAQRLVNSAEDESRETNYRMQTLERQSYKDALDRDYAIELDNISNASKAAQNNLKNIQAFSQTAVSLLGDYMKAEEERKVAAAHDVISRTGVTFDQMVAFQKMNDNLTRSEFAAQDNVQQMLGPDADPTLVDAMFTVYQNRNTKRWVEHKQLFQNSLNKFPEFLEEKIRQYQLQTNETITDIDGFMSEAKREFMDVNFVGKARPEVLSGAKVYATLDKLANSRRDLLMKDKRALNEKELSYDRQNAFAVQYNEDQIAGLIRYNSINPSFQKRQDLLEFLKARAGQGGAFPLGVDDIDALLDSEGGGSNGMTLEESFPAWAMEVEAVKQIILQRDKEIAAAEDEERQRRFNERIVDEMNKAGADREGLTALEVRQIINKNSLLPEFFGVSTDIGDQFMRLTTDAQRAEQTDLLNNQLWMMSVLDRDTVLGGHYLDVKSMNKWLTAVESDRQLFSDASLATYNTRIESLFNQDSRVQANRNAFGKYNDVTYSLAVAEFKRNFKQYTRNFLLADPKMNHDDARKRALFEVSKDIKELVGTMDENGRIPKYGVENFESKQLDALAGKAETVMTNMRNILGDKSLSIEKRYENVAKMIDPGELETALTKFGTNQWRMPAAIEFIGEETNKNPLQVLEKISPYVDENLRFNIDALRTQQKQLYSTFEVTPYTPIRNTYRTPERTGRANVGDTKTGASAPVRPSMLKVVQYVSGDPAIRGKSTADRRIVYDNGDGPRGHGGKNYHNHYEFATPEQAAYAKYLFEKNGFRVTSYLRPNDTGSAHSRGVAIDVAPSPNLPYTDEAEMQWSASANAVIGFDPLANE